MKMTDKIKADLEEEKSKKILEEIKAQNPIVVEDFEVPKPSDEDIQKMMQQQQRQNPMGNPQGAPDGDELPTEPPTEAPKKAEPKKPGKK